MNNFDKFRELVKEHHPKDLMTITEFLALRYSSLCLYTRGLGRHVPYVMIHSWAGKVELMALAAKVILLSTSIGNTVKNKNKEYGTGIVLKNTVPVLYLLIY
jgi:hypothetical protein